jgi:hypothetical protein
MAAHESTAGRYTWLWLLAVAMGYFEASVVVYLRQIYYPDGFRFPIALVYDRVIAVEIGREAASLVLLAAAARLAGRAFLERFAAFMILFGVWDLVYYLVLKLVLDWPPALGTWDILFLIPVPWSGPVWAPCLVSLALVTVGTYLYWTPARPRLYRRLDWAVVVAAGLLVIASFMAEWRTVVGRGVPDRFPLELFAIGWILGAFWFVNAELRSVAAPRCLPEAPMEDAARGGTV